MPHFSLLKITAPQMMKLGLQAVLVLIIGFVLWRVMAAFTRKKAKPKKNSYFDTKYREKWKNK